MSRCHGVGLSTATRSLTTSASSIPQIFGFSRDLGIHIAEVAETELHEAEAVADQIRVIDYLADEFRKEQGVDLRRDKLALQRLKEAAEKAKIELSSSKETEINLPFIITDASGPNHLVMKLTRAKFESLAVERGWRVAEPPPEVARELAAAPVSTTDTGTASAEADPEKLLKDAVDAWKRRETIDAIRLATIAAEQGHGRAQELLGHLYGLSAEDDIRNYVQAYMWYHLAAEHLAGTDYWWMRDEVIKSRDWVGKMMPPIQLAEAQRRASEWMEHRNHRAS